MADPVYPSSIREIAEKRRALAPECEKAFQAFSRQVFADGALPAKTKQLIAVAVAHVTQCPYCIRGHTRAALRHGAGVEAETTEPREAYARFERSRYVPYGDGWLPERS